MSECLVLHRDRGKPVAYCEANEDMTRFGSEPDADIRGQPELLVDLAGAGESKRALTLLLREHQPAGQFSFSPI